MTEIRRNFRLDRIRKKLNENPEIILNHFGITYVNKGGCAKCECPVHKNSDNETALSLYLESCNWVCHTRNCQEDYHSDLLGLVWGILSNRNGKRVNFPEVLDYCESHIGIINADNYVQECDFTKLCSRLNNKNEKPQVIGPKTIINTLEIPSPYFQSRGFSPEILRKFSIGDCHNPQKPMFNRAVCPIFDDGGENIIGCAGRRIEEKEYLQKWKYSYGFKSGSYLYGLWLAKSKILETSRVILVEGMTDVARLHELGYTETVGLFGVNLTNGHLDLLNKLGVMNISVLLDGDEAGILASNRIYEKCKDYFNIKICKTPKGKDPDELSEEELQCLLK